MKKKEIRGRYLPDRMFNKAQLVKGLSIELEHTRERKVAKAIAKDHLREHKDYYKALELMEKRLSRK